MGIIGVMTLDEHLKQTGESDETFGSKVGVSKFAVSKWRRGERVPRPAMMKKIAVITVGKVGFSSWYEKAQAE